jgi:glutamate carboxypeptidase
MTPADVRDLLIRWAEINSGSGHAAGLARMHDVLRAEFGRLPGAETESIALDGTPARALRIRIRPQAPRAILFSGHYDTVYDADSPFQRCESLDADRLRGPGVADMKGGLVMMLLVLQAFDALPEKNQLGFEVLLTPDEETGSVASRPVIQAAAATKRFAVALVFEPARANGDLVRSRKGTGFFQLTCHGRAAHAGRNPEAGRNAILALAEVLPAIDALNRELDGVMLNIGSMHGGSSAANVVPDLATAVVNIRITRQRDEVAVLRRLREIAEAINRREGFRLEISGRFNRLPKECTAFEESLFVAWQACARERGVNVSWQDVAGGSDGNLLSAAGLPNLDGVGPVGDHPHSPNEFVRLSSLVDRAAITVEFLRRFAHA